MNGVNGMNRRNFLKVFGIAAAAPSLLVKEAAFAHRLNPEIISTGFKVMDSTMLGGGLRRGEMMSFVGYCGTGKSVMTKTVALNAAKVGTVALIQDQIPMQASGIEENCNGNLSIFENYDPKNIEYLFDNHDLVIIDKDLTLEEHDNLIELARHSLEKYSTRFILTLPGFRPNSLIKSEAFDKLGESYYPLRMSNYVTKIGFLDQYHPDRAFFDRCKIKHMKEFLHNIIYPYKQHTSRPVRTLKMIKNRFCERHVWAPAWIDQNHTFTDKYFDYKWTQLQNPDMSCFQYEDQPHSSQG